MYQLPQIVYLLSKNIKEEEEEERDIDCAKTRNGFSTWKCLLWYASYC
jgi:hypothetical protein